MTPATIARTLGQRGGRARAARLSAAERQRIAALGARARLASLRTAQRIAANFRYAAAAGALRGAERPVRRVTSCRGLLPGIYPPAP